MELRNPKTVQFLGKGLTIGWVPSEVLTPGVERWGLNSLIYSRFSGHFDDWTRWFDLHTNEHVLAVRPETYTWYTTQTKPIYRLTIDPIIPSSIAYPLELIQDTFHTNRFLDSLDYMFALALLKDFKRIELCWFTMEDRPEHRRGATSANYWIGRAEERGVEVIIHGKSALEPPEKLYGFETVYK